jgi:anion-transporting  ArsA/GET3 family ATPase
MNALFDKKRIFLIGGPGGVGKTTLAAALGVALAEQGYRTVVLTVDPAKRLAQALGFEKFPRDIERIPLKDAKGELWASMLDTERYFDRVIEKFATTAKQKDKILSNPLYRTMVDSLGGSHEYAAMERLLEFARDKGYDKVIVDTPPSDNARELFEAPQRLADFMDNSVLRWFQGGGKLYTSLFRTGTKIAMGALKLIFGGEFLDSLGGFLGDLEGMQAGFRGRNLEILEVLRSPETAFFLVTVPSEIRAADCESFRTTLKEKQIPLARLVFNRLESDSPLSLPGGDKAGVEKILAYKHTLHSEQEKWARQITTLVDCPTVRIQRRTGALHDVAALSELGRLLIE